MIGTVISHYRVLRKIGGGGMGVVYEAEDQRLGRHVALKFLPPELANDPQALERFQREARALSALNHPNICHLYDVGRHEAADFLVMEFLEGESLAERLKRGALPTEQLFRVALEIADALSKAHRKGILHRDLKPSNIVLSESGSKLLDFGLAKPIPTALATSASVATITSSMTREGSIVGTFQYMSPEQLEGREADARSDIFSFGAL